MKSIYEKSELTFSLLWIIVYIVAMSLGDYFSSLIGIEKIFTTPIVLFFAISILIWIRKSGESKKYGLIKGTFPQKTYLYFIPLIITVSINFWGGVDLQYTAVETILYIASMLCVGFVEEIIFRGFLFKALCKKSLKVAIIVSSLTFGFGHVVNLLSGADFVRTLLQIGYATAAGFLFTIIFYKSKSLLPCIITHSLMNATSVFARHTDLTMDIITSVILTVILVGYMLWILKISRTQDSSVSTNP